MTCIRKNDVGTVLEATIKDCDTDAVVDVQTATTQQFFIRKPDGSTLTKTTTFTTTGVDGKIEYTSISGDFDIPGLYYLQAFVILASGEWHTTAFDFEVKDNFG